MIACEECKGNGLIEKMFFPDPKQPTVRRAERLRCPSCNGLGSKNAR